MVSVTDDRNGTVTIKVVGELCFDTAAPAAAALSTAMSSGAQRVVVDLEKVPMLSAGGLRVLVAAATQLLSTGRSLSLVNAHGIVQRVLEITDLDELVDDVAPPSEATAAPREASPAAPVRSTGDRG
jgi:anti-sigma B factor antagonist